MYNRGQISPERGDDGEKDTAVEGACTAKRGPRSDVSCSYVAQACSSSALIVSGGSLREALVSILRINLFAPVMMMVGRRTQLSDHCNYRRKPRATIVSQTRFSRTRSGRRNREKEWLVALLVSRKFGAMVAITGRSE